MSAKLKLNEQQVALLKLIDKGSIFSLPPSLWGMVTELTERGFLVESNLTPHSVDYALTPKGRAALSHNGTRKET
jgi:hypothetical protein